MARIEEGIKLSDNYSIKGERSSSFGMSKEGYVMNSSEERVENNRRAYRKEMEREMMRMRDEAMREFLGGSPRLVESVDESNGINTNPREELLGIRDRIEYKGDIKRRCYESMEGSSEEVSYNNDNSPIGLEEINSEMGIDNSTLVAWEKPNHYEVEMESPTIVPFGNLRKVDEMEAIREGEKMLNKSQRRK